MTLEQELYNVSKEIAKDVYSKYVIDAYQLNGCASSYDRGKLERLKLRAYFTSYGLTCTQLEDYSKLQEVTAQCPMDEAEPILNTTCECSYVHIQTTPSMLWTVDYSDYYYIGKPNVTTVLVNNDGTESEINGVVTYATEGFSLTISFSEPLAGKAYLS